MSIKSLKVTFHPSSLDQQTIVIASLQHWIMATTSKIQIKLLGLLMLRKDVSILLVRMILLVCLYSFVSSAYAQENAISTTVITVPQSKFKQSHSYLSDNNGRWRDGLITTKTGLMFIPWEDTEFYLNGGLGFHSNDALSIETGIGPVSGDPISHADSLTRTYGAGIGMRNNWLPGLQSTVSVWWLDIDSEPLFESDAGSTSAGRPSRRYGVEWANYCSPTEWLTFDTNISFSRARFRDDEEGIYIPGAIESVVAAGATFHDLYGGFFGNTRLRYMGPRPLIEDNSVRANSTFQLSAMLGYQFNNNVSVQAEIFNLLNLKDSTVDYFYRSRLPGENLTGLNTIHFQPVEPLSFRMSLTVNF